MEKIVNRLINDNVKGVDTYFHNGSMWLIFTDKKEWIIELEKSGNLWYNYGFFLNLFKYLSLDVIENQHYITKWVEDTIQNGVKDTKYLQLQFSPPVEDTIQNGVKDTKLVNHPLFHQVEDTIQNGVKNTNQMQSHSNFFVEDTIQNGIKKTNSYHTNGEYGFEDFKQIENVIQDGVKHIN
jgi:hypothetical protein